MEERVVEMRGLNTSLRGAWSRFGESLGLGEGAQDGEGGEDADSLAGLQDVLMSQAPTVSLDEFVLPWRLVLEAMLAFLPEEGRLFSFDPAIREEMEEFGLTFAPAGRADLARFGLDAGGAGAGDAQPWGELAWAEATGHRLLARRGKTDGPAWLDRSYLVLLPAR
jgi:hypothetical protein